MKYKLLFVLAAAAFGVSIGAGTARADDTTCVRNCITKYHLCMKYTPDKAALCQSTYQRCVYTCTGGNP